ncbi:MAG: SsrA-binding protein SmpB [Bacilli bacterium]|jgi:SsrA-binding protein|nr:SsrA-binding protein SmpB [Bacilli bacterium]
MEKGSKTIARNKKANHEYFILDVFDCGIVLQGTEIKSIRETKVSINEAYCQIKNNELFIINMNIAKYSKGTIFNHEETRNRKLLAHRREINKMTGRVAQEGLTLIPLEVYLENGLAKVKIALAKGKKLYDKREDLKEKTRNREVEKSFKGNRYE